MSTTAIPTIAQLRSAPQLAALAILDAALVTAEEALLAHHPVLDNLDEAVYDAVRCRDPPSLDGALVPVLVARFDELHHLLGRYHLAVRNAQIAQNDDFPF
jgi:hypothetical protein